ncbi:MAG: hypothetical protein ACKVRN_10065 [Pyrinomonadaceae bacterium]
MTSLESFSEGTSFQPLIISVVYPAMMGNGTTLRNAAASYRPKGSSCQTAVSVLLGLLVLERKSKGEDSDADATDAAFDLRKVPVEFWGFIKEGLQETGRGQNA